jgi:hypothetical protein
MSGSPVALQFGSTLRVFVRGGDNAVYNDTWNGGGWSGFGSLGGIITGNPSVSPDGGFLEVAVNTPSNHVYLNT